MSRLPSWIGNALTDMDVVGKTLAYTSIKFTNEKDELVARGSHTKYNRHFPPSGRWSLLTSLRYVTLAWKDPNNIVEELSPRGTKSS